MKKNIVKNDRKKKEMKLFCWNLRTDRNFFKYLKQAILFTIFVVLSLSSLFFLQNDLNSKYENGESSSVEMLLEEIGFFICYAIFLISLITSCSMCAISFGHLHYINNINNINYNDDEDESYVVFYE